MPGKAERQKSGSNSEISRTLEAAGYREMKRRQQFSVWSVAICSSLFFFVCDCKKCDVPPSSCGSIRNISYPFRLKTDVPHCGVRICELRCEADQAIFYLDSQRYDVEEISYEMQALRLVDFELANSSCPLSGNILAPFEPVGPFNTYDTPLGVFLLKCSGSIENPEYTPIPSNCSRTDHSYFFVGKGKTIQELNDQGCHVVAAAPLQSRHINRNFSFSAIRSLLQIGFHLWWDKSIINWHCEFNYTAGVITSSCRWHESRSKYLLQIELPSLFYTPFVSVGHKLKASRFSVDCSCGYTRATESCNKKQLSIYIYTPKHDIF